MEVTRFGLRESPFRNQLDVRWFYESPAHEEALARLFYLIEERYRVGILTGPAGTGKSLLLAVIARQLKRTQRLGASLDASGLDGEGFLFSLASTLGLSPRGGDSRLRLWQRVEDCVAGLKQTRTQLVLLLDHLDRAEPGCAGMVRWLMQRAAGSENWLTTIAAIRATDASRLPSAWGELMDLRVELGPLDLVETSRYLQSVVREAGGSADELFPERTIEALHEQSGGLVRELNRLCELSLLGAAAENLESVTPEIVAHAAEGLLYRAANDPLLATIL